MVKILENILKHNELELKNTITGMKNTLKDLVVDQVIQNNT